MQLGWIFHEMTVEGLIIFSNIILFDVHTWCSRNSSNATRPIRHLHSNISSRTGIRPKLLIPIVREIYKPYCSNSFLKCIIFLWKRKLAYMRTISEFVLFKSKGYNIERAKLISKQMCLTVFTRSILLGMSSMYIEQFRNNVIDCFAWGWMTGQKETDIWKGIFVGQRLLEHK